jgi:hypothetical protein
MNNPTSHHLAIHLRQVFFGGNWCTTNLRDTLSDVKWNEATKEILGPNTIAVLTSHMTYYVTEVKKVLQGQPLLAKDDLSFSHGPIKSNHTWEVMQDRAYQHAADFADLIAQIPDDTLWENFTDEKYGNYYRNISGIIEHLHYHLGQIVLLKKLNRQEAK